MVAMDAFGKLQAWAALASSGNAWWRGKSNAWPIGGRASEFNAGGL
jgi:hypothetical protein